MKSTNVDISAVITTIFMSILVITGLAFPPAVAAGERNLEITGLSLTPDTIPVNQPFYFEITFKVSDSDSTITQLATVLHFKVLKNNKTLFTSKSYPISARSGEVKTWVTHMNPVSVKGTYTISAHVRYEQLTAEKRIELAIVAPPKAVNRSTHKQSEPIRLLGKSPPVIAEKDKVHVRHILVKSQADAYRILSGMSGLDGQALKNKFVSEAKLSSIGPSGNVGGDLGMIKRGRMVAEFEDAAFSLSPGTITISPVKTVYGYHIIYREE